MKKLLLPALMALAVICASAQNRGPALSGSYQVTVELDPEVRTGVLGNGLTYYIRHHDNPRERADFYIVHNVGALQEDDDQDGLAHFLEHMAFNGTKHFPKKGVLEFLSANGVMFGTNVNAYTTKSETVYNLSNIPLMRESFIDSVLLILHDWSSYITCDPEEIEAERGVVREEWRRSDEPRSRTLRKNAYFEYMNSKHARRTVLGDWDVVNNFTREQLLNFYHKWYRPDLQAIIVVGDIDPVDMESRVIRLFSALPKSEDPALKEEYDIPCTDETVVGVVTDPDIQYLTAKIYYKQPYPSRQERGLASNIRYELMRGIYNNMLSDRLAAAEKAGNKAYKKVVSVNSALGTCRNVTMLTVMPDGNELALALEDALAEIRRVELHGFTAAEFDAAKARYAKARRVYEPPTQASVKNQTYVRQYVEHFLRGYPYMEAGSRYDLTKELFESITADDINAMVPRMLTESERLIIYTVNENNTAVLPGEDLTREILDRVDGSIPSPPDGVMEPADLEMRNLKTGRIVSVKVLDYCGAQEWTLSNGAKVVWQQVDNLSGPMDMALYAYSPEGYAKQCDIASLKLLDRYFSTKGIRGADGQAVEAALVNNNFTTTFAVRAESTFIKGNAAAADFGKMLEVLYLSITEPNFSEAEVDRYLSRNREQLAKPQSSQTEFRRRRNSAMYNGHPWATGVPTVETCDRLTAADARTMYDRQFGNAGEFTFFISGSLCQEQVRPLVEKYIATLPSGNRSQPYRWERYEKAAGANEYREDIDDEKVTVPKASIERKYYGSFGRGFKDILVLDFYRHILAERYMKSIREEKGGTYYVAVAAASDKREMGYTVDIGFETDPELVHELLEEVSRAVRELAAYGPTEKEINETRMYMLKRHSERKNTQAANPAYWNERLFDRYMYGFDAGDEEIAIRSVKASDVKNLGSDIARDSNFTSIFIRR